MRLSRKAIGIAIAVAVFAMFLYFSNTSTKETRTLTFEGKATISVEIADEPAERERGLMFRDSLPAGEGMLFVFEEPDFYGFWMKNVKFPIDMIWTDSEGAVVHIEESVPPCSEEPCSVYTPSQPALYVVETNAGFVNIHGIAVGDEVRF